MYVNCGTPLSKQTFLSWETQKEKEEKGKKFP